MFNLLDASGGIGVTERMAYILKVRQLAVAIAKGWVGEDGAGDSRSKDHPPTAGPSASTTIRRHDDTTKSNG
jgi:hypothetical protein